MGLFDKIRSMAKGDAGVRQQDAGAKRNESAAEGAVFRSTRGEGFVTAPQAVLQGLAPDGGLYVDPGLMPKLALKARWKAE